MDKSKLTIIPTLLLSMMILRITAEPLVFSVNDATKKSYTEFISKFRDELPTSVHSPSGIKVLHNPATMADRDRYFEVKLTTQDESLTVGIDRTNVYTVAYNLGSTSYFFKDEPASTRDHLFLETNQIVLPFEGCYGPKGLKKDRRDVPLGFGELQNAINVIHTAPNVYDHRSNLLVIIQMLSEAARFEYIVKQVRYTIFEDEYKLLTPPWTMLDMENEWKALSTGVQQAVDGFFPTAVSIRDINGIPRLIRSVTEVYAAMTVMLYIPPRSTTFYDDETTINGVPNYLKMVNLKDATFATDDDEMTVHI